MVEHLLYIVEIFVACILVELLFRWYDKRSDKRLDIGCDYCEKAAKTRRTPDKRYWLCKECMSIYKEENGMEEK